MTTDEVLEFVKLVLAFAMLVATVGGVVHDRRERRRLHALFAAQAPLPGSCEECRASGPTAPPPHVGGYRTSPRPQAMAPRKAPWWRRMLWRLRGGPKRLADRRIRHSINRVNRQFVREWMAEHPRFEDELNMRLMAEASLAIDGVVVARVNHGGER